MLRRILFFLIVAQLILAGSAVFSDPSYQAPNKAESRYLAVVSDFHMGLGKVDKHWHPYEDFRWPNAFRALLNKLSDLGQDQVDLVIAGDFLDLWQIPDYIACKGNGTNLGCSIPEMVELTRRVVESHADTLRDLAAFSQKGHNRVHFLPGNHDAALMLREVWSVLREPLQVKSGHIQLVTSGIWASHDGSIIVEHGHQIPGGANRYENWPCITDPTSGLLQRPGGEQFVQQIFNDEEKNYPIIDNLSPMIKGAWYRAQDRGKWRSIGDLARLITFYLFETSLAQKTDIVKEQHKAWDIGYARKEISWKLFAYALPEESSIRTGLLSENSDPELVKLRRDLTKLIVDQEQMSADQVRQLCDQAWQVSRQSCLDPKMPGGSPEKGIITSCGLGRWHLLRHLETRRRQYTKMTHFIYGHTHQLEIGTKETIMDTAEVDGRQMQVVIYNSGAFQRVMDTEDYKRRLAEEFPGIDTGEGLTELTLEKDFRPCYTAVIAPFKDGSYKPETKRWLMDENNADEELVDAQASQCEW